jgi:hypothetical protein
LESPLNSTKCSHFLRVFTDVIDIGDFLEFEPEDFQSVEITLLVVPEYLQAEHVFIYILLAVVWVLSKVFLSL